MIYWCTGGSEINNALSRVCVGGGRRGHIYFVRSIGIKILPLASIEMSIPRPIISTFSGSILSN